MSVLLGALQQVPQYLISLFTGQYKLYALIVLVVFLVALLVTNRVVTVLRDLFVLAAVAGGAVSYFRGQYEMFWIFAASLVILLVFRLLRYIIVSVTDSRRSRKIERVALAKAEKRRGSWKARKGYSGERPEEEEDESGEVPYIRNVNVEQVTDSKETDSRVQFDDAPLIPLDNRSEEDKIEPSQGDVQEKSGEAEVPENQGNVPLSGKTLTREQAISAAHKLRDLKDLGIMTPEEFEQIKARLYSRLG